MMRPHAAAIAAAALICLAACSKGSSAGSPPGPDANSTAGGSANENKPSLFSVPADQMAHVQVVTIAPEKWTRILRLPGNVSFNGFLTTPVITQVGGPVSRITVSPGQDVQRGQPMLYVSSPDYSQLRATYLKARDAHALAHKNYARAQDLFAHHAIAERDLEAAQSAEVQAEADLQSAEQSLRVLGIPRPDELTQRPSSAEVPLLAPLAGEVVERLCAPGQLIQAGTTQCFTISNMNTVWVLANVYEDQLAYVHVGDPVTITTEAYPDQFHGRISYMGAALDPNSRTLQARIDTTNPQHKLKKDMYVTATVVAGQISNAIAVPDSSVLRDAENQPYVYVLASKDQFARRQVTIADSQNGKTRVLSGLQMGEQVAGDGSLFLQFETSLQR
ncbi:MAG TPA: efflux RND transporter periplasmic adaptor subunit [Terriglobales bacterium]|nr:efflux RND transporter periplasmic adaptor subunit [Terriglobales bacterium]